MYVLVTRALALQEEIQSCSDTMLKLETSITIPELNHSRVSEELTRRYTQGKPNLNKP